MFAKRQARAFRLVIALIAAASLALGVTAPASATRVAAAPGDRAAAPPSAWRPVSRAFEQGGVAMAPGTSGRLFVAIERASSTVVAGFDASGRLLPGWPRTLSGWTDCWIGTVRTDGSVRLVCTGPDPAAAGEVRARAFGLNAGGQSLAGWPVDLTRAAGSDDRDYDEAVVVGSRLFVLMGWDKLRLVRVGADGALTAGTVVDLHLADTSADPIQVHWTHSLGSDGTAFAIRKEFKDESVTSSITAFGLNGVRAGWPVAIRGNASRPTIGPDGRTYVVVAADDWRSAWIRVYERSGARVRGWSPRLAVVPESAWRGAGAQIEGPAPAVVARDGRAWLVGERVGMPGMKAWALTPTGRVRAGWPVRSDQLVSDDRPGDCSTGGGSSRVDPVAGPGDVLYVALDARSRTAGGRIAALGTGGRNRPGWPVALLKPGAQFRSIAVGANGTVYALATETERHSDNRYCTVTESSATILAIRPDGTIRYRLTVMDP